MFFWWICVRWSTSFIHENILRLSALPHRSDISRLHTAKVFQWSDTVTCHSCGSSRADWIRTHLHVVEGQRAGGRGSQAQFILLPADVKPLRVSVHDEAGDSSVTLQTQSHDLSMTPAGPVSFTVVMWRTLITRDQSQLCVCVCVCVYEPRRVLRWP